MWLVQKQFIRDRVARSLSNEISPEKAYKRVASSCFDEMFKRAEKYPKHHDHTVENLVSRVKKFIVERRKAANSEKKFKENPGDSSIDRWPPGLRKCEYSFARYNELHQELKDMGVRDLDYPECFFHYTNLEEVCIEKEVVIARVLLQEAFDEYHPDYWDKLCDAYGDEYTEKIVEKKYSENLSWLEAAEIVTSSEELRVDLYNMIPQEDMDEWYY